MSQDSSRSNLLTTLAIVAVVVVVIVGVVSYQARGGGDDADDSVSAGDMTEREDSHVLDDPEQPAATLVEFLDFECEACGAAYPLIEQVRERYDGQLKFVIRYFPLDGHLNSRNAAHAVESAARQGEVEQMYSKMFQTQAEWGESQEDQSPLFRGFAEEMGLDMDQYDRDVTSESVAQRVERDYRDGLAAGVSGTPTFYLDGEKLEVTSVEGLYSALDEAVSR